MSITVTLNGEDYQIPTMGESNDWGDELNRYLIALAGNFNSGVPVYVTETFTTGANVDESFPRTLTLSPVFTPKSVWPAQVTATNGSISVSGGWPTWHFTTPDVIVDYLPGLEADTEYTVRWAIQR